MDCDARDRVGKEHEDGEAGQRRDCQVEPDAHDVSTPREEWERRLVWNVAQGTTLDVPDCTIVAGAPGESVTVACESATYNAPTQAVGAIRYPRKSPSW